MLGVTKALKKEKTKAVHKMPTVKKASHRPETKSKVTQDSIIAALAAKNATPLQQDGLKVSSSIRRVQTIPVLQTIQDPNIPAGYNLQTYTAANPKKMNQNLKQSRSVRFGDNEVKEFVRESAELRFEQLENKVIITDNEDLVKEYGADEEKIDIPVYKPFSNDNLVSEDDGYADPAELADRIERLKYLAENLLNVASVYLGQNFGHH